MTGRTGATLVAGIDSSTQATKVVVREAESGALVREARAPHPPGTEVEPSEWEQALESYLSVLPGQPTLRRLAHRSCIPCCGDRVATRGGAQALELHGRSSAACGADLAKRWETGPAR
jgi:hypothetical protein